ncbi:MAG TPA: hypothetical protein VFA06_09145, partial [Actinocrinis sp.]|uniref:hypothetical protein n=1 Tax=Actinocrinis sp. TaxID=1920516 RepID=UPI002D5E039D
WNEHGYDANWFPQLRSALNSNGYSSVQVVAADANDSGWSTANALAGNVGAATTLRYRPAACTLAPRAVAVHTGETMASYAAVHVAHVSERADPWCGAKPSQGTCLLWTPPTCSPSPPMI